MAIRPTKSIVAAVMAVGTFLLIDVGRAQEAASLSQVKVTVDPSGAVIAGAEVVFKSEAKTIVSHTGPDGSVVVPLPRGRYSVSAILRGFQKEEIADFQVSPPDPNMLDIGLKIDPDLCKNNSCVCSPCAYDIVVPTVISELPGTLEPRLILSPYTPPSVRRAR